MFEVLYFDDNKRKHLTYLKSIAEVAFYRERFNVISFNPVQLKF